MLEQHARLLAGLCASLLSSVAWSVAFRNSNNSRLKHLLSGTAGAALVGYNYGLLGLSACLVPMSFTFLLVRQRRPSSSLGWAAFAALFSYLLVSNVLDKMKVDLRASYRTTYLTSLMILVAKLTSVVFDAVDGEAPGVSLLEFFGYCFYFPSVLSGPIVRYRDYLESIERVQIPLKGQACETVAALLKSACSGILHVGLAKTVNHKKLLAESFYLNSWAYQVFYFYCIRATKATSYYFAWGISDACCTLTGLNYRRERAEWGFYRAVNIASVELGQSVRDVYSNWNIPTARWLHVYLYQRLARHGLAAIFITNTMSALWHGLYAGYFVTFFSLGLLTVAQRNVYRKIGSPTTALGRLSSIFITQALITVICIPFILLGWRETLFFERKTCFVGPVLVALFLAASFALPAQSRKLH